MASQRISGLAKEEPAEPVAKAKAKAKGKAKAKAKAGLSGVGFRAVVFVLAHSHSAFLAGVDQLKVEINPLPSRRRSRQMRNRHGGSGVVTAVIM